MIRLGATQVESIGIIETIIKEVISGVVKEPIESDDPLIPDCSPGKEHTEPEINAAEILANLGDTVVDDFTTPPLNELKQLDNATPEEYDPVAAAVSSIMDIDSMFNIKKSPVKNHAISPYRDNRMPFVNSTEQKG